ncbi:membrane protein [Geobacillus kaustophilus GBlys]|uniref:Membrane protein n=5 Tax=Geobacillus TaxID=129337 RepID=U2Y974_GEOKU|nr:membrane protein [Geobacillus kaustophilus GBlys]
MDIMVLLGTIVNGVSIIAGALIGKWLHRIPERVKETVMGGIGLAVALLGIQMGMKSEQFLVVIFSLVFGGILGEWWNWEEKLNRLGQWLEVKVSGNGQGSIAKGFVSATLLFVIGAMAIVGALDSGLRGDHSVLYTKSILDGFASVILTTTLGIGVIFSALPVVVYEGSIALLATQIERFVPKEVLDSFIAESTATGGILIMAIGLNMLGLTNIRVANLLPSILITAAAVFILSLV